MQLKTRLVELISRLTKELQPFMNRVCSQNRSSIMAPDGSIDRGLNWHEAVNVTSQEIRYKREKTHPHRTSLVSAFVCFLLPWYILIMLRTYLHKQVFSKINTWHFNSKKSYEAGSIPYIAGLCFCLLSVSLIWFNYVTKLHAKTGICYR